MTGPFHNLKEERLVMISTKYFNAKRNYGVLHFSYLVIESHKQRDLLTQFLYI